MKNLLKMSDLTPGELTHILDVADQLKAQQKLGGTAPLLAGKTVAMLFSKASTRTRTSFEVGVYQLGGLGNYMNTSELQAGRGEPLKDTARVLGRYYDCVVWRTYRQRDLEEFAELAGVPVINGLTDYAHPCQVLADLMTIRGSSALWATAAAWPTASSWAACWPGCRSPASARRLTAPPPTY